jgi:hypothetical protein
MNLKTAGCPGKSKLVNFFEGRMVGDEGRPVMQRECCVLFLVSEFKVSFRMMWFLLLILTFDLRYEHN